MQKTESRADKIYRGMENAVHGDVKNRNEINGVISTAVGILVLLAVGWKTAREQFFCVPIVLIIVGVITAVYDMFRMRNNQNMIQSEPLKKRELMKRFGYIKTHFIGCIIIYGTGIILSILMLRGV